MSNGEILRNQFQRLGPTPAEWEPLTFGELEVGDRFISFPLPGDNHGHGGFRRGSWLFTVKEKRVPELAPGLPYSDDRPHGRAILDERHKPVDFSHSAFVLKVTAPA